MSIYNSNYNKPSYQRNSPIEVLSHKNGPRKKTLDEYFIAVVVISSVLSSFISTLITYFILRHNL